MQETIVELALKLELAVGPKVHPFPIEDCIFKLALVVISIGTFEDTFAVDDIGIHVALISVLDLLIRRVRLFIPCHLAVAMHLRVYEVSDIVTIVRPFELSISFDLGILEITTVDKVLVLLRCSRSTCVFDDSAPLLKAFSIDFLPVAKVASDFYCSPPQLFGSLSSHFVTHPVSIVLRPIQWLLVFTLPVEKTLLEATLVNRSIRESLHATPFWILVNEGAFNP